VDEQELEDEHTHAHTHTKTGPDIEMPNAFRENGEGYPLPESTVRSGECCTPPAGSGDPAENDFNAFYTRKTTFGGQNLKNLVRCCFLSYLSDIKANIG